MSVTFVNQYLDGCFQRSVEPIGKCILNPVVKTKEDFYDSSKPRVKLSWHKIYSRFSGGGELLAGVELLEVSEDQADSKDDVILKIPAEVKPNFINHRIEVVFWGVRDLKKVQMSQITKPKITIECCNTSVSSDALSNAKKNLNFTNPIKLFELNIPEQEYAPPICLKMFDCRDFGINVFAGTHVAPLGPFFYKPLSSLERESKLMHVQQSSINFVPSLGT